MDCSLGIRRPQYDIQPLNTNVKALSEVYVIVLDSHISKTRHPYGQSASPLQFSTLPEFPASSGGAKGKLTARTRTELIPWPILHRISESPSHRELRLAQAPDLAATICLAFL